MATKSALRRQSPKSIINLKTSCRIFFLFAVPTAMNVFIMTKSMDGDDGLAANVILASVPCSVVVMTIGIYLMRMTGIV